MTGQAEDRVRCLACLWVIDEFVEKRGEQEAPIGFVSFAHGGDLRPGEGETGARPIHGLRPPSLHYECQGSCYMYNSYFWRALRVLLTHKICVSQLRNASTPVAQFFFSMEPLVMATTERRACVEDVWTETGAKRTGLPPSARGGV